MRGEKSIRTSISLPQKFLDALELIKGKEEVLKSSQIKIGLVLYFERYRGMLVSKGLNFWEHEER